jgi:phage gp36-like protein
MTYADESDLTAYFGSEQLLIAADRDGDGTADTGVVSAAISAAEEEIDSYVGVRYTLPLDDVPGVLTRVCCDLAMYHMSIDSPSMTEQKETRYNNGIKWLTNLAKGIVTLGVTDETEDTKDTAVLSTDAPSRVFTRTKMGGLW